MHPWLSEVGQWTRQNCILSASAPAFHTYLHEIEIQARACAMQMAKNDILFDIKEYIYSEDQGIKKQKRKSVAVQVELYISTKNATFLS